MKTNLPAFLHRSALCAFASVLAVCPVLGGQAVPVADEEISRVFDGREAVLVMVNCASGERFAFPAKDADRKLPPCSTFKIVNTLIGLETGEIHSAEQPFYQWDGQKRSIEAWNRDLTLREAFQASCVPAFQALARQIGAGRMREWIDRIGYGDRNTDAGIDVFWLPARGRKTILVSPSEQAELMCDLVGGKLPFDAKSVAVLREVMLLETTERGTLYGKTGSGMNDAGIFNLGWFVGFVESGGETYAFACAVQGENVMSKDAREIVESVLRKRKLL